MGKTGVCRSKHSSKSWCWVSASRKGELGDEQVGLGRAKPRAGSEGSTSSEMTLCEPPEPDKDETEEKAFGGFFLEIEQGVSGGWIWMDLECFAGYFKANLLLWEDLHCSWGMDNQNVSLDEWCKDIAGILSMACTTTFEIRESKRFCVSRWLRLHESGEGRKAFFQTACG